MNKYLKIIGISTLTANSLLIFATFMVAYLNNNEVLITINSYGEAQIEFVLMLITLPICIGTAIYFLREERKKI